MTNHEPIITQVVCLLWNIQTILLHKEQEQNHDMYEYWKLVEQGIFIPIDDYMDEDEDEWDARKQG